jgi:hypothetical protein
VLVQHDQRGNLHVPGPSTPRTCGNRGHIEFVIRRSRTCELEAVDILSDNFLPIDVESQDARVPGCITGVQIGVSQWALECDVKRLLVRRDRQTFEPTIVNKLRRRC